MAYQRWIPGKNVIADEERPYLRALGAELRRLRDLAGLSQRELGERATLTSTTVGFLENGRRRTRRSTLTRIVSALVTERPDLGGDLAADPVAILVDRLCELAGPALADESQFREWTERTLARRQHKPTQGQMQALVKRWRRVFGPGCSYWHAYTQAFPDRFPPWDDDVDDSDAG